MFALSVVSQTDTGRGQPAGWPLWWCIALLLTGIGCSGGAAPEADATAPGQAADAGEAMADAEEAVDDVAAEPETELAAGMDEPAAAKAVAGDAPFDTTFLDVQTELFIHARVSDILSSNLVQVLTGGSLGPLGRLEQQIGVPARDIATVTVGVKDLAKLAEQSAASLGNQPFGLDPAVSPGALQTERATEELASAEMPADEGDGEGDDAMKADPARGGAAATDARGVIAVVRTKSPIDAENLERAGITRVPQGNKAYYRLPADGRSDQPCLYVHSSSTLIVSEESTIKEIITQGDQRPKPTADLSFIKSVPHLLIAVAPRDKATLLKLGEQFPRPNIALPPAGDHAPADAAGTDAARADAFNAANASEAMRAAPTGPTTGPATGGFSTTGPKPASDAAAPPAAASQPGDLEGLLTAHADAVSLLIDLTQGVRLDVACRCNSTEGAQQIQSQLAQQLTQLKAYYAEIKPTLPGGVQLIADPLVESLASQATESLVTVSTTLPEEQQASLAMLPMALMGLMMSNLEMSSEGIPMGPSPRELAQEVLDEGQSAANADELPAELELKALARWGENPYGDQAPAPLEIGVVATGGPARDAVAFGQVTLGEAKAGESAGLKWIGVAGPPFSASPLDSWVPVERDDLFGDQPEEGVAFGLLLVPPVEAGVPLTSLIGEVRLQVPAETLDVLIPNVASMNGAAVEDERLASADMQITSAQTGGQTELTVSYTGSPQIGKLELVGPDGEAVQTAGAGWVTSGDRKTVTYAFPGSIPPQTGLRVTVYAGLQDVAVPFRFENLPLPETPERSPEQQALLVWTRGESPKEHPDLTIEAQGRWRELKPVAAPPVESGLPSQLSNRSARDTDDDGDDAAVAMPDPAAMSADDLKRLGRPQAAGQGTAAASDEPLFVVVDLIGPLARDAEELGGVRVTSVKTDIDTELAFEGADFGSGFGDPTNEFVPVDRDGLFAADGPPGGLRITLKLTPPSQPISGLAQVNGMVTLRTVRERTEAILPNLQARVGKPTGDANVAAKPVNSRELLKFGLKPVVALEANRVLMRLLEGKDERISDVSLIDLNGVPISNAVMTMEPGTGATEGHQVWAFEFADGVPQKIGMKISVNMGIKEIEIPIRLRDLPLPPRLVAE